MAQRQPIFVGDVQGCAEELEELLARAEEAYGEAFEVFLVGDLVNRGPFNLRVLRAVRTRVEAGRAHVVLGNHELNLLRIAAGQRALSRLDSVGDVLDAPDADDWIDWLRRLPVAVTGTLGAQGFALVHAAVHPDWDLAELDARARRVEARLGGGSRAQAEAFLGGDPAEDEDLDTLMRLTSCRSVHATGAWSSLTPGEAPAGYEAWHGPWSRRGHAYGVVYGHWALQGLHCAPGLRGLDTGCVHHGRGHVGRLTAWLPDPRGDTPFAIPDEGFWSVVAKRAYYAHRDLPEKRPATKKSD